MMNASKTVTLISWNVNGIRAVYRKGFLDWLYGFSPDIVGIQESRAGVEELPEKLTHLNGYHGYWHASETKKGYSGTALLTVVEPVRLEYGLGIPEFDGEGRTIIAFYPTFVLLNCYFPNGGRDKSRVPFKMAFYEAFLQKCEALRHEGHAVIFCGDVNTAHREIDLSHPKANAENTGFLPEERAWIDRVIAAGYVDTFRHLYPDRRDAYTWWSVPTGARKRNIGWRLDYFFIASEALGRVRDAFILSDVLGSDHCPVGLVLASGE